jgi:hypothetical protein
MTQISQIHRLFDDPKLLELLSDLEHDRWSRWMRYLFGQCDSIYSASMEGAVIPDWAVERWSRQMETPYALLSGQEKESDRKEARNTLVLLKKYLEEHDVR